MGQTASLDKKRQISEQRRSVVNFMSFDCNKTFDTLPHSKRLDKIQENEIVEESQNSHMKV